MLKNSIACVFFLAFCILISRSAYANGWYTTNWGMSEEQVQSAISMQLDRINEDAAGEKVTHIIQNYAIGSKDCVVKMKILSDGLSFVIVSVKNPSYSDFSELYNMLLGKYGQPVSPVQEQAMLGGGKIVKSEWISQDTTIRLNYALIGFPGGASTTVNIQYRPRIMPGSDKL